jgi:hypothetical protein
MTSDKVAGVIVENGDLICLNERGGKGNRLNGSYACAAVCGDDLVAVRKNGEIVHFDIDGPRIIYSAKGFGKSYDPVSIQLNHGLNFTIHRANGQSDVYTNGQKTRTIGEAKNNAQMSFAESAPSNSSADHAFSTSADSGHTHDIPDGFMAGMGYRCKRLIDDPIPGPWAKISVSLSAVSSAIAGVIVFINADKFDDTNKLLVVLGLVAVNFGICYWLRNVISKVLVRSWYGAPIVILGTLIGQSYPEVGGWVVIAGAIVWLWPVWPIALIAISVVGVVLMAIGKTTPTMGNKR